MRSAGKAELYPHLDLSQSSARRIPTYARVDRKKAVLGNGFLEMPILLSETLRESGGVLSRVSGDQYFEIDFSPFEAWFDCGRVSGAEGKFLGVEARTSPDRSSLIRRISFDWFDAEVLYTLHRGDHFFRKCIIFHNLKKPAQLHRLALFTHRFPPDYELVIHDGGMFYPIIFVRSQRGGLFYCMDVPGYFCTSENQRLSFYYCPGETLEPGRNFQSLMAQVGVCELTGRIHSNPYHETGAALDAGERQWFREYVLRGAPPTHVPRIEVKAPEKDIDGPCELEILNQCEWFGAKHVVMPRMLASLESYPLAKVVKEGLERQGISASITLSREQIQNVRWVALAADGSAAGPDFGGCFASEEFRDFMVQRYLEIILRHNFRDVDVDGAPIVACHNRAHGHASGIESLQKAFQGLLEVVTALEEEGGRVRCSGPYGSYGAGLARLFDSLTGIAEAHPLPLPDVHVGRLFADMQRLYFRRSHDFLLPKSKLRNSIGLVPESCPEVSYPGAEHYSWYLYHDRAGWRYNLLSAIATGLCHRFHALPQDLDEVDRAFAAKWLAWERDHLTELMEVEEILDEPGLGPVDGYSYTTARSAIVFLFNTTYDPQKVQLHFHLGHDSDYIIRECYPREMNYLGPSEGLFQRDSALTVQLEPKEARVLEAVRRSPASAKRRRPEMFGAPGHVENGNIKLLGKPGSQAQVGIRTPRGFARHKVQFPGSACPQHIRNWVYMEYAPQEGFTNLPQGAFSGEQCRPEVGTLHNAWLCSKVSMPAEVGQYVDTSPFELHRPCWAYPDRLFFVVRFEPPATFDPIRTSSDVYGIPEGYMSALPMKYGVDLSANNLGLRAWINGEERPVYPALAAWTGYAPNPHPVVAYFLEAGSLLNFGARNHVVLFAKRFDASSFRGIVIEHLPLITAETLLDMP